MKNIVYGLKDPRNDVFQYIGKSSVGDERALSHLTNSHSGKVKDWVDELNSKWLYPIVEIIEEVDDIDLLPERERYYIQEYYETNPGLLNSQCIDRNINKIRKEQDEQDFNSLTEALLKLPSILKTERICRRLSQDDVSGDTGLSRSTVSLCENGGNVTINTVVKYLLYLKGIDLVTNQKVERVRKKD